MQRAVVHLRLKTCLRALLAGVFLTGGASLFAGEKIIYEDNPGKSDLPDADARRNFGREKFDQIDRKSSVSGMVGVPEIPFILQPRSKKQLEQADRQKNFLLTKPEGPDEKFMTPEEALGVRHDEWVTDPGKPKARNTFEQFLVGDEGPSPKGKQEGGLADMIGTADRFRLDLGKSQLGVLGQLQLTKDKKGQGPQVEQPDLFGGTMTATPFSLSKSLKEKEKTQNRRDDFARLLDPKFDATRKDLKAGSPFIPNPGEASSVEPIASFGVEPGRKDIGIEPPISPNSRAVNDLVQRRDELLAPFQQGNKARSGVSFGTIDPTGSRFLNLNSSANSLVPTIVTPTVVPRPAVLEFPSRKF